MSRFITEIPVAFETLTKNLPQNVYIHSAVLSEDKRTVSVEWDHPAFQSPVNGAWPFPIKNIESGDLPDRVTLAEWAKKKPESIEPKADQSDEGVGKKDIAETVVKRNKKQG